MKLDRQRIIDIFVTALVGAGIAFLQSVLTGLSGLHIPAPEPEVAGSMAGIAKIGLTAWRNS